MSQILENISSINWWVGVVLVGLAINLVAAYAKPRLDDILGRYSERRRKKNIRKQDERQARIDRLAHNEHEQLLNRTEELRLRIRSFGYMFMAFSMLIGSFWILDRFGMRSKLILSVVVVFLLYAIATLIVALDDWRLAVRDEQELNVARELADEERTGQAGAANPVAAQDG